MTTSGRRGKATRCAVSGKAAFSSRKEARATARSSSATGQLNVYRCVACNYWHYGHVAANVASGEGPRLSKSGQARVLGVQDAVVRRCPICGAEGTLRTGILHAASCSRRHGRDETLPLRR